MEHITVCICTYKRPEMLANLLKSVQTQMTQNLFTYSIVVVDNDRLRSAEKVVYDSKKDHIDILYVVEERKNISIARNKAIDNATGDYIAFIDDDEIPEQDWVLTLYKALKKFQADAVLGPVFPVYQVQPPNWVIRSKLHLRPTYETGIEIDWRKGRTGNLLIKKVLFDSTGIFFDPRFGQGGEDQDLTQRMLKKGFRFIWCNEARVNEIILPVRWNIKNMLMKSIIRGRMSAQYPDSRTMILGKSLLAIFVYSLALPFLILIGFHLFVQYLIKIGDHAGRVCAILFGIRR